jgi:ABC-2 type transport system permease protein
MTTELGQVPQRSVATSVSRWSRIYGLGSVYAKTLRDSRLSFVIITALTGGLMLVVGAALGQDLSTAASRKDLVRLVESLPPILSGLAGNPVNIGTLGGYLSWKYGPFFALIVSIWSILALSSTLATEAERGSLDFVATAPYGKRRVALEKLTAHLTLIGLVVVILAICSTLVGSLFGTLPEDAISPAAAVNFALWVGLIGLASGSVAFALAPFIGRGSAAGIAGIVMLAGFLVNGYQASVPVFRAISGFSWFSWTAANLPLAGQFDWFSLVPVALAAVILLWVGIEAFARRDLGVTTTIRWPGLPAAALGIGGPVRRSLGERLPVAIGWGIGIGVLGFMMAAGARSIADALAAASPGTLSFFHTAFPDFDLTSAGSFLELTFVSFGFILAGFAAAALVGGWGSDESSGRLEMLLTAPLARSWWAIAGGLGVLAAIAGMTVLIAVGVGIGSAIAGGDVITPIAGTVVLGLYAAGVAGIGLAVGGLVRSSIAGEAVAVVVTLTFLIDLVGPALKLPDWVHEMALSSHLGQPMLGHWDWFGIAACLVLAVGGIAVSGWGMSRRDVAT